MEDHFGKNVVVFSSKHQTSSSQFMIGSIWLDLVGFGLIDLDWIGLDWIGLDLDWIGF